MTEYCKIGDHEVDEGVEVESVQISNGGWEAPPEYVYACAECIDRELSPDVLQDVVCIVCDGEIENHLEGDPPVHRDCDLSEMEG